NDRSESHIPGENRRQIEERQAHPHGRVEVAAGPELEAGDRDQEHHEVGLRKVPSEEGQDAVENEVRQAGEDQPGDDSLPDPIRRIVPVAVAVYIAWGGDEEGAGRSQVGLAVNRDREAADSEGAEREGAGDTRILDRRPGEQLHKGHSVPTAW